MALPRRRCYSIERLLRGVQIPSTLSLCVSPSLFLSFSLAPFSLPPSQRATRPPFPPGRPRPRPPPLPLSCRLSFHVLSSLYLPSVSHSASPAASSAPLSLFVLSSYLPRLSLSPFLSSCFIFLSSSLVTRRRPPSTVSS